MSMRQITPIHSYPLVSTKIMDVSTQSIGPHGQYKVQHNSLNT